MPSMVRGEWITHRILEPIPPATAVAAEAGPPGTVRAHIATLGYESVIIGARLAGGIAPTVVFSVFAKDEDEWFDLGDTAALSDGETAEFETFNQKVYVLATAVTGNPTEVEIKMMPGRMVGG